MRSTMIAVLFLTLIGLPGSGMAQQAPAADTKKTDAAAGTLSIPRPVENWTSLTDLKSGLEDAQFAVVQHDEQPTFVRDLVRVQWRLADPIDLWIAHPKTPAKAPVVLYLYNYNDSNDRFRDAGWCQRATEDGFAAVGFVAALTDYRYKFRPMRQWFVSELPESLGASVHDVQLILNYLASRDDLDMDHVGMFGMGSGGSIAILAASADPRITTVDLLDPWGDWPDWLQSSPAVPNEERAKYTTPEFLKSVASLDPVKYLPELKTQHLRLQQNLSEGITPPVAKERIANAVPDRKELVQYKSADELFKEWKTTGLSGWIKEQIRSQKAKQVASNP